MQVLSPNVAVLASDPQVSSALGRMLARAGSPAPAAFTAPEDLVLADWPGRRPLLLIVDLQAIGGDPDLMDALIDATSPATLIGVDGRRLPSDGHFETLIRETLQSMTREPTPQRRRQNSEPTGAATASQRAAEAASF